MNDKLFPRPGSNQSLSALKHLSARIEKVRAGNPEVDSSTAHTLSRCSSEAARKLLPYEQAVKLKVLPLGLISFGEGLVLTVAAPVIHDAELISALRFATGHEVKLVATKPQILNSAIHFAYCGSEAKLDASIKELSKNPTAALSAARPAPLDFRPASGDVAQLLASLIDYAVSRSASDLHLLPLRDGGHVKMRVKGELFTHEKAFCNLEGFAKIISRLKVLASLDVTQRTRPQDGSFIIPVATEQIFARLSIMPTVHGEKAVIRLMNSSAPLRLDELGLDERSREMIDKHAQRSEGSILFAGPTGSGKTTTMYALLQELVTQSLSVVSIEDPVEIQIPGVAQTSIDEQRELGYSACLRSILRQDPDVILLGEMRDEESAKIALQAALTGHLLLSTVHARDAVEVLLRLRALNADLLSVAQAVSLIVCQRLLPSLCPRCKVIDLEVTTKATHEAFKPVGCTHCDYSGYSGRALVTECLEMHQELYEVLVHNALHKLSSKNLSSKHHVPLSYGLEKLFSAGTIQWRDFNSIT